MPGETEIGGEAREFPNTRWTMILASRDGTEARKNALEVLLNAYWKPLYYYVRRKGRNSEQAKDVVQGFMLHLLERDFLSKLDPKRGRLRGYLKIAVNHFLINLHESASAAKRGGGAKKVSLDWDVAESGLSRLPESPDTAFDRQWAEGIMERATEKLKQEYEKGDRTGPFELVRSFFTFGEAPSYADASKKYNMSIVQLKAFLHRARKRFRELVRDVVADTVADESEIESEISDLVRLLGK